MRVSMHVCVCDCVFMLRSKKPRFIWRSQFSFTAAASWLLDLTVLFSWLKSGSFHSPPKQEECHEVPMVNHIHIYILGLIQNATNGRGCVQIHNGTALKNHNAWHWCKNKPGSTV